MIRALFLIFMSLATCAIAFEEKPWLGNFLEFYLDSSYTYSRFRHVQNAVKQTHSPSNNHLIDIDLGFTPLSDWEIAFEAEFAHTPRQSWGRRSVAMQIRTRWLDDITCDPVSLTTGISARQVAHVSVKDISSPYASRWDFELHAAIGNEWSRGCNWTMRWYGIGALGQGNRGSPWTRARLTFEWNLKERHQIIGFGDGYWGLGPEKKVDIQHFHGWGKIDHSSVDLGLGYRYITGIWGYLWVGYAHRVWARSYPQAVNFVQVGYHLPFSFFSPCP